MWNYLEELYLGKNLSRAFDVIQEMFWSEKGNKTLLQYYVDLNKVFMKS